MMIIKNNKQKIQKRIQHSMTISSTNVNLKKKVFTFVIDYALT